MEASREQFQQENEKRGMFLLACARGFLPDVQGYIDEGVDPRTCDSSHRSGAHFSAARGEVVVLELLHSKGVDLDAEDESGRGALHYAALGNHEGCVKYLVEHSCWVDGTDGADDTPLHCAARAGAADAVARLLKCGAKPGLRNALDLTPMAEAVCKGHVQVCIQLQRHASRSADALSSLHRGASLLHLAAGCGQARTVDWLLSQHACAVDMRTSKGGLVPLHCAVLGGAAEATQKLCAAGADCKVRDEAGRTPAALLELADLLPPSADVPALCKALGVPGPAQASGGAPTALQNAALREIQHAGARDTAASDDGGLTPAARLSQAETPEDTANVFLGMPKDHQRLRLRMWTALPAEELDTLPQLTTEAKQQIQEVRKIEQYVACANALGALKQDARFQEDMRNPQTRSAVDAVIDNPDNVLRIRNSAAMACLDKLRRLRDVGKRHGGGAINLDEATTAWTDKDAQRACIAAETLDSESDKAVTIICSSANDGAKAGMPAPPRSAGSELQDPESPIHPDTAACRKTPTLFQDGHRRSYWSMLGGEVLYRGGIQLLFFVGLFFVLWFRGALPPHIQSKADALHGWLLPGSRSESKGVPALVDEF